MSTSAGARVVPSARRAAVLCVIVLCVAYAVTLATPTLGTHARGLVSNYGQLVAAGVAAAACWGAARRCRSHRRTAWRWMSAGLASWTAGQASWTWAETVGGVEVPFPSVADVGFLLFPACAGWGLVVWLGTERGRGAARGRDVMDGLVVAGSLLTLSWSTVLTSVIDDGAGGDRLTLVLSLAYPVSDLVVGVLALMALTRVGRDQRRALTLLTLGLGAIAYADSAFMYLESTGGYHATNFLPDLGWFFGFALVAVAGTLAADARTVVRRPIAEGEGSERPGGQRGAASLLQQSIPYLAPLVTLTVLTAQLLAQPGSPTVAIVLVAVLVAMVLLRQLLAVGDDQRLLAELRATRDALEHRATHDGLTGLANRMLFSERLHQALGSGAALTVVFCDLDDFKQVNDRLGHQVGDQLLRHVATCLLGCVRDGDLVARMGGDEFVLLLDDCDDVDEVVERVRAALDGDVVLGGRRVRVGASLGVAHHRPTDPVAAAGVDVDADVLAESLLHAADAQMYRAKHGRKGAASIPS